MSRRQRAEILRIDTLINKFEQHAREYSERHGVSISFGDALRSLRYERMLLANEIGKVHGRSSKLRRTR